MYQIDPDSIVCRAVDDEMLALDLRNSRYLSINRTATVLWPLLERGSTFEQLQMALTARWSVSDEQARFDVAGLLEALSNDGILVAASEDAAT
jgi:Coenzyme PQQ synthesis protein D (PqqD)